MAFMLWLLTASVAYACLHEQRTFDVHSVLAKRQERAFPPALTAEEATLVNSFDNITIDQWSYYYTHGLHLAGTNESQAQWTADRWAENGFTAGLAQYYAFLNYPVSHSLVLTQANGSNFTASLQEAELVEDETTDWSNRVPTFHGYSATGDVEAEYVYVGRGQQADFKRLEALGVPLEGKIALARYGGPFRGLKVKNAQAYGMIGAVLFTDTADDGNVTEANGYAAYLDGPARNPTSVQRGSVLFLSTYPGDPTTPGYPSKLDSPRADIRSVTPQIPSLPVPWKDAQPLLQALDGYGSSADAVNRSNWVGALNATYNTGPAPGATLSLSNVMESNITWVWDAVGVINGTSQDEVVVIGNHRDAWIVGGAADPNSGSAIMIELSKAFGALLKTGWRPKRTIVLCSWDGEEYGMIGSTEWVEEYIPWLTTSAVSYLNIDIGVSGPNPNMAGTPDLHAVAIEAAKKVVYPYRGLTNVTMYDVWYGLTKGEIGVLGSGSDYTPFVHSGISSLDIGAGGGPTDPVYHYHSNYDSYHWMANFGDPGFLSHKAMGQWLTLIAYALATREVLPLDVQNYGAEMTAYLTDLEKTIASANATLDLSPLSSAISTFNNSAAAITQQIASSPDAATVDVINSKLRDFQRGLVSQGGLPDRLFYRNVVFAPGVDTGYAPVTFPGITEAVEAGNFSLAEEWIGKTSKAIEVAAGILVP